MIKDKLNKRNQQNVTSKVLILIYLVNKHLETTFNLRHFTSLLISFALCIDGFASKPNNSFFPKLFLLLEKIDMVTQHNLSKIQFKFKDQKSVKNAICQHQAH